jgi:hypothetical protein
MATSNEYFVDLVDNHSFFNKGLISLDKDAQLNRENRNLTHHRVKELKEVDSNSLLTYSKRFTNRKIFIKC